MEPLNPGKEMLSLVNFVIRPPRAQYVTAELGSLQIFSYFKLSLNYYFRMDKDKDRRNGL
jgi:hypothetical protein